MLILYFLLIVLGIFIKKNKPLFAVMVMFSFMLFAYRYGGADYTVYQNRFIWYKETSGFTELLFTKYISLFHMFNLNFESFMKVSALLCLILPTYFIWKMSDYPCRAFAIYMLYSMPIDGIQIRNSISFAFVLIGFIFLLKQEKNSEPLYLFFVIAASLFHTASILFLIFLPVNRFKNKKISFEVFFVFFLELLICYLARNKLQLFLSGITSINIGYFLSHAVADNHIIFVYIIKSLIMFLIEYCLIFVQKKCSKHYDNRYLLFLEKINLVGLFIIPLYFFGVDLYRMQRYLFVLNIVGLFAKKVYMSSNNRISYYFLSYGGFCVIYYLFLIHTSDYMSTIIPMLNNNVLF